jgi:hypothetical protein
MTIEHLSSDELFELAKQKREQEETSRQAEVKAQVEELKAKRSEILKLRNKEVNALDADIRKLTGKSRKGASHFGRTPGVSAKIIEIIGARGEISTKEISAELRASGIEPKNLSQTMAYLKRRNQVISVGYGAYSLPQGQN